MSGKEIDLKAWVADRQERRTLRQKLYLIRLTIEAEKELTKDQLKLAKKYEDLDNFPGWSGFPDRWDIGDPKKVRRYRTMHNPDDKAMVARMLKLHEKKLDEIVIFGEKQYLDKVDNSVLKDWRAARIKGAVDRALKEGALNG